MPDRYSHIKAWNTWRDTATASESNEVNFCTSSQVGTKLGQDVVLYGANGIPLDINSEGRADVVQHAHPNSVNFNFSALNLTATQYFILIDISDTTNYPHDKTGYVHLEWLGYQVDASSNADYEICIGFLENVDATNGDFYQVYCIEGSKTAGQTKDVVLPYYPNGPQMVSSFIVTSRKSLNDTTFQTDVNLASTLDPATINTPSGNGDLVVKVEITAGELSLVLNGSYHTHD